MGWRKPRAIDDATREVVTAFQRHFRQARVDGVADPSTLLTLRALIETRPAGSVCRPKGRFRGF